LLHAILNVRTLPPDTRAAWRALFEHYVFGDQTGVTGHIPPHRHGVLGRMSVPDAARIREYLAQKLAQKLAKRKDSG
jgi:hypothetical protein